MAATKFAKQCLRLAIGAGIYAFWALFRREHLREVKTRLFASHSLSFLDRQGVAFLLAVIGTRPGTASSYWAGGAGRRYHWDPDHRVTVDFLAGDDTYRRPMLDAFAEHAAAVLPPQAQIVEVGCGQGSNLLYLRQRLAGRQCRFVGYDVNPNVIAENARSAPADVRYETRDCFASGLQLQGDVGLIFCAVLMYAHEDEIVRLLSTAHQTCGKLLVGLSEPTFDPEARESTPHNILSFAHGYARLLRRLGLRPLFETLRKEPNKASAIYHAVFE